MRQQTIWRNLRESKMVPFKEFRAGFQKKYVSLEFDEVTNNKLMKYAQDNGFDLTVKWDGSTQRPKDFKFHVTVFHTTSQHNTKNQEIKTPSKFTLEPTGLKMLGAEKDVPVLSISPSGKLLEIRNMFVAQGYKDEWPNYSPHISLSYNRKSYDISGIPLPDFPIQATRLIIKNQ